MRSIKRKHGFGYRNRRNVQIGVRSLILCIFIGLISLSCGSDRQTTATNADANDTLNLRYASLLHIVRHDSLYIVSITDPWHPNDLAARYILVPRDITVPKDLPEGTLVRTPLQRVIAFSTVHAALCSELGAMNRLLGVCDADYVYSPTLRQALDKGELHDYGTAMLPDVERIAYDKADALFVSPYRDQVAGPAEQLGIPIITCADYMETSPLARAEWIRFYGLLMGEEARADSIFQEVESDYLFWQQKAKQAKTHPTLMVDLRTGPVWYVAGGHSTMGRMYQEAGMRYLYADNAESGSVSLNFEQVFSRCHTADYWFVKYGRAIDLTYSALRHDDPRYAHFQSFTARHIIGCNTLRTAFYEDTPFHPNRLLKELVCMFHPELAPHNFKPVYLHTLEE